MELAILGSFIMLVLGALVNYGLNADYNQQTTMQAFRNSLTIAAKPSDPASASCGTPSDPNCLKIGSANVTLIQDRYLPDPSNPFGGGSDTTAAGSGSVVRDFRLSATPDTVAELPRTYITLQGQALDCPSGQLNFNGTTQKIGGCTTSGFRQEDNVDPDSLERYNEIYGAVNICDCSKDCGAFCSGGKGEGDCSVPLVTNPSTGQLECPGGKTFKNVRIMDPCEGETVGLNGCMQQARQIINKKACQTSCESGRWGDEDAKTPSCTAICDHDMYIPWYAQGASCTGDPDNPLCTFPNLDALFNGRKAMGLQPNLLKVTATNHQLQVNNSAGAAQTTSIIGWLQQTARTMVYYDRPLDYVVLLDPLDPFKPVVGAPPGTLVQQAVNTTPKDEHSQSTWTTPW